MGWIDGQNVRIDVRFGEGNAARMRKQAAELVALSPDVIVTFGGQAAELVLQATRTIPIVFANVADPVGSGFVESLAEPGGNATGLAQFEYSLSAKWPELLKEIAPNVKRVAVIWDPTIPAGIGQFAVIQSVAPAIGIDVRPISVHGDIESVIAKFARVPNGGLIVTASAPTGTATRLELITTLAARYKLPAIRGEWRSRCGTLAITISPPSWYASEVGDDTFNIGMRHSDWPDINSNSQQLPIGSRQLPNTAAVWGPRSLPHA